MKSKANVFNFFCLVLFGLGTLIVVHSPALATPIDPSIKGYQVSQLAAMQALFTDLGMLCAIDEIPVGNIGSWNGNYQSNGWTLNYTTVVRGKTLSLDYTGIIDLALGTAAFTSTGTVGSDELFSDGELELDPKAKNSIGKKVAGKIAKQVATKGGTLIPKLVGNQALGLIGTVYTLVELEKGAFDVINWGIDTYWDWDSEKMNTASKVRIQNTNKSIQGSGKGGATSLGYEDTGGTKCHPVPEPTTMVLMGSGLAGLIGARRKKK